MDNNIYTYFSHGKLLLTGEYLVLKGAKALALPVNLGQKLELSANNSGTINWVTFEKNKIAFTAIFSMPSLKIIETTNTDKANYIATLLTKAKALNPEFLNDSNGYDIKASIQFNMNWGLGTSSTLINNIAQWACVDAFKLNHLVSKGSGYDIACAQQQKPLVYQLTNGNHTIDNVDFKPPFIYELNLVYLNKKMNTETGIQTFLANKNSHLTLINIVNDITLKILNCQSLDVFMKLMAEHEALIENATGLRSIKSLYFSDFNGEIKSLGAWGGDFALVASSLADIEQQAYFYEKGFSTFFPLSSLLAFSK